MRRIIINCLLIIIVAAAPNTRDKRHLSYIKDFIWTLLEDDLTTTAPIPILGPEEHYEFFRIPGYNDISIKTIKCKPEEVSIVDIPSDVEIYPFESYIGTKNIKETGAAFRNTYKLLSTGILHPPETGILKRFMVPIVNDLRYKDRGSINPAEINTGIPFSSVVIKQGEIKSVPRPISEFYVEKNIRPLPGIPRSKQPKIVDEIDVNQIDNYLHKTFDGIVSPKQLDNIEPVIGFSAKSYPGVGVRQKAATNVPKFINQDIHEYFSSENKRERERQKEYEVNRYISGPIQPDNYEKNLSTKDMPVVTFVLPSPLTEKPVKILLDDTMDIVDTTGRPKIKHDNTTKYNLTSTDKTITKFQGTDKDTVIPQDTDSSKFQIVKEKDEINSHLFNNSKSVKNKTATNNEQKMNNSKPIANKKENDGSNLIKSSEEVPVPTLSQYIYEHVGDDKSHPVNILKEKNEIVSETTTLKAGTSLPLTADKAPVNVTNKKDEGHFKTVNDIPKNKTLSEYIYKRTHLDTSGKHKSNTSISNNSVEAKSIHDNITKTNDKKEDDGLKINKSNVNNSTQLHLVPDKDIVTKVTNDNQTKATLTNESNDSKSNNEGLTNEANKKMDNSSATDVLNDARIAKLIKVLLNYNQNRTKISSESQTKSNSPLRQETVSPLKNISNASKTRNDIKTNNDTNTTAPSDIEISAITNSPVTNTNKSHDNENLHSKTENRANITSTNLLAKISAKDDHTTVKEDDEITENRNNKENLNQDSNLDKIFETVTKGRGDIPDQ